MAEESRTKLLNVLFGLNTSVEFEHIDEDLLVDDRKKLYGLNYTVQP